MPLDRPEDNRRMNKQRDLLPWILGGLSTAAVALAITAISSQGAATPAARPIAAAAIAAPAESAPPQSAPAQSAPASAAVPAPAALPVAAVTDARAESPANPAAQPEVRPGQIWTCTTRGVKTFSNNPCGENSSLLEVRPINTMNPTTPLHYARNYPSQRQYMPPYSDPGAQSYAQDDSDQEGYEDGANSYTVVQGVAVLPRRRTEHHPHRPAYRHGPASAPRKF